MEIFTQLKNVLKGKEGTLKERLFCTINIVGGSMAILGILESFPIANSYLVFISLALLLIAMAVSFVLVLKFHAVNAAAILEGLVLCGMVLPNMYYANGGIEGGATVWFIINIVYTFLMFEGKQRIFFICMDILADCICYGVGYFHPEMVRSLPSREAVFVDSLFSVVLVGLAVGLMLQVYISTYTQQRALIEAQKQELEKAGKSKDHFFASMSHEIRTPINSIIGFNEMILRENPQGTTHDYAESVQNASKMLLSLVNDILDVSQMEMKKMEIIEHPYSMAELIRNVVGMMKIEIEAKNLELQLDIDDRMPTMLIGDRKRIQQILVNLMTNAVKYTTSGTITLGVRIEEQQDSQIILKIVVKDTGIGIRKENLASLYESFKRIDDIRNENIQGSGLGLTITKQLVDLMGGEISVDSIYSKGSTFTVLIPQKVEDNKPIGTVEQIFINDTKESGVYHQSFEAPEAKILVVDDNAMNLKVFKSLLSSTGVQIDIALSGEECLEKTLQRYYHVVFLDHKMPGLDGVETLARLQGQENGLCRDSAVIALTANAGSDAGNYYRSLGFDDYLEKPLDSRLLEQYILAYLPDDIIEYSNEKGVISDDRAVDIRRVKHKKKRRVMVTTDCVAELSQDMIKKYGIGIMYLYIRTEHGRFADTREINSDNLMQYLTDDSATAFADSVSIEEYEEFFAEQLDKAEQVVHISMASNSGKSYSIALAAAQGFDHVHIIDAQQISCGQSLEVLYAARLAYNGYTAEQVVTMTNNIRERIEACYILPSAKIFYQNGYTNALVNRVCNMFKLHPILKVKKSRIRVIGFSMGSMQMARVRFIREQIRFKRKINPEAVYITHVGLNVKQQQIIKAELTKHIPFEKVFLEKASFSCACNTGMGTFGFAYFVDK